MQPLRRNYIRIITSVVIVAVFFILFLNLPSSSFPTGSVFTVAKGESLTSLANDLKARHVIRSKILFLATEILFAGENRLIAGDYYFSRPVSTLTVAERIMSGSFNIASVRVTIPEGSTMKQVAGIFSAHLPHFVIADFMKYYPREEGYLFPDTYFFEVNMTADEVIEAMHNNYNAKIAPLQDKIKAFGKSEKDVVTMASILEEEAKTKKDWSIISGILWKRIKIGMPLQVDSTTGSGPAYDTYAHKGLPPTPISSPGLYTIEAAFTPTTTPYLYYLSDKQGLIHYATTFDQHIANKIKYLR